MPPRRRSAYRRLSESPLWDANRRYYQRTGIDAWRTATVPHYVTNNVPLASAYARVVQAFVDDHPGNEPLHLLELGAGCGRFAFLFLRALEALRRRSPGGDAPAIRYVMTDVSPATIDFWRRHEALAPFVRAGQLDFARFDAESDREIHLAQARHTISARRPTGRIVVIANYVFDGLRHDAFGIRGGRLHDYLAATSLPSRHRTAEASMTWRDGARVVAPYADDDFNAILSEYGKRSRTGRVLFPVSTLRCLARLATLAREDVLVLAADRGTVEADDAVVRPVDLEMARHGSVSLPVNFHALRRWVTRRGGRALKPSRAHRHLHIAAFLLGTPASGWAHTIAAYHDAIGSGGPDELYTLRRGLTAVGEHMGAAELLALIRLCGYDPRTVAECIRPLWRHLETAGSALRLEIRDAVLAAWANYYHVGEPYDLAFNLALLLYETRAFVDAHGLFEESIRLHGEDGATRWNLGLCEVALGKPDEAVASFQRARTLAPTLLPAGLAVVKAGLPARSGRPRLRRGRPVGGLGGRPEPPISTS